MTQPATKFEPAGLEPPNILHMKNLRPPKGTLDKVAALVGREFLFAGNFFIFISSSVFVARLVSRALQNVMPEAIAAKMPDLMRELTPAAPVNRPSIARETEYGTARTEALIIDGIELYRHRVVYPGQDWPCPQLRTSPCASCEWYVEGGDGRSYCAPVVKMATRQSGMCDGQTLAEVRAYIKKATKPRDDRDWTL